METNHMPHGARAAQPGPTKPASNGNAAARPGRKRTTELDRLIGARIRLRRVECGMTQAQLAESIGVTFQQVQKYESGTNRVGGSRLAAVAGALEVPVSYFFDHTAEETEAAAASLLNARGALSLLRAFAAIRDERHRTTVIDLARRLAGQRPLREDDTAR